VIWRFLRSGETTSVRELVTRHEYAKAIGVLRAMLKKQPGDRRLRLDLAEVFVHAGQKPQAVEILLDLADELFRGDFRARARVVLKRVEELEPGRPDVAERMEVLNEMERAAPWRSGRVPAPRLASLPEAPGTAQESALTSAPAPADRADATAPLVDASEDEIPIDTSALESEAGDAALAEPLADTGPCGGPEPPANALLEALPPDVAAELLAKLRRVEREPGDVLVTEGEKGSDLFLIVRGTVSVFVKDKSGQSAKVTQLRAGDFFGEIGALTGLRRIATVTAATRCELLVAEKPVLAKLLSLHPEVRNLLEDSLERRVGDPLATAARGKRVRRRLPDRRRKAKKTSS
jgi:cyclic nucleotide-binding protein/tetratricopeptide repeat protein